MANTTESKETVSRKELATYLRNLADQFESDGDTQIQVGNKSVAVHPPENVKREVTVIERSALLRGDKEALELDIKWKKNKGASGRATEDETEVEATEGESESESETEIEAEDETGDRDESDADPESRTGGD